MTTVNPPLCCKSNRGRFFYALARPPPSLNPITPSDTWWADLRRLHPTLNNVAKTPVSALCLLAPGFSIGAGAGILTAWEAPR